MKTKLDELLEKIDPDVLDQVGININEGFASINIESNTIEMNDCKEILGEIYNHLTSYLQFAWRGDGGWAAIELLSPILGPRYEITEIMRTGTHGGVYGVSKILAKEMEKEEINFIIECEVKNYLSNIRHTDEFFHAYEEYYEKLNYILPKGKYTKSSLRNLDNFKKVLKDHPFVIKKLRAMGSEK